MKCNGESVIEVMKLLYEKGLITVLSGNASVRCGDSFLITPSGVPKHQLKELTKVDLRDLKWEGPKPSIEYRMHAEIYLRSGFQAVVHAHNPLTVALAESSDEDHLNELIGEFVETKYSIREVGVVDRLDAGSLELAEAVGNEFSKGKDLVIMRGHGVIAGGKDPFDALNKVEAIEYLAKVALSRCPELDGRQAGIRY